MPYDDRDDEDDDGGLDESEYPEPDEDDDDAAPCEYCGKPKWEDCERCPHCGDYGSREDTPSTYPRWVKAAALVCLAAAVIWALWG